MGLEPATNTSIPKTKKSNEFAALQVEYQTLFDQCVPRPDKLNEISAFYVKPLKNNRARYEAVGMALGIPWVFIGIIHGLEGSFNFKTHLHNGDPLTARTVQVPVGRPETGMPPFTWEDSAKDALILKGYDKATDWSVPRMLHRWEKYNGFGYRALQIPTPYLWGYSNLHDKGKFVQDGKFSPTAITKQCGAAVLLKVISAEA